MQANGLYLVMFLLLHAVLRNYMYSFMCRLSVSRNTIIIGLNDPTLSDARYFYLVLEALEIKFVCLFFLK